MIRKYFIILSYSFYFVFVVGLLFHTSSHPHILGKYTLSYSILLLFLILGFGPVLWGLFYFTKPTVYRYKKKRFTLIVGKKILGVCVGLILLLTPVELYFRQEYAVYEQSKYRYTRNNFHPFLQFQPTTALGLHINSWGFRAGKITKEKTLHTYRIFILGGSTVYNSGITYEKTFSKLLEDRLQKTYLDKKIEVINAGVDGYTTEHVLIQYLFSIKDFSPDMIIMWQGMNDWYYGCSPKQYVFSSYKSDYSHYTGGDAQMVYEHFRPQPIISLHFIFFDKFLQFLQDNWYSDIVTLVAKVHPSPGIYDISTHPKTYEIRSYPSLPSYKRNLQSIIDNLHHDNVSLILGNQAYLYKKNLTEKQQQSLLFPKTVCSKNDGSYPDLSSMIKAMEKFNTALEQKSKQNSVPFVNLEKRLPKTLEYFTDDVHYTEKGNSVIAHALYEIIIKGGYIY